MTIEIKLALVHDYLFEQGGAENVVEALAEIYPAAPIYTSIYNPAVMSDFFRQRRVISSFLQRIGQNKKVAKSFLLLYPLAFRFFNLDEYDIILSSTTSFAKWVQPGERCCHICFCHTPTRFLWTPEQYPGPYEGSLFTPLLKSTLMFLKKGDYKAAQRVDYFIANSEAVRERIRQFYGREAAVIHSPIDCSKYRVGQGPGKYFLVVSRMLSYKRIDLAIKACNLLNKPLVIIGNGPERENLKKLAGSTVKFLGRVDDHEKRAYLEQCQALILPGQEDFGLTPLEAMASGRPVIAYRGGGALETVVENVTGEFFYQPEVESLAAVLADFRNDKYDANILRSQAEKFDVIQFQQKIKKFVEEKYEEYQGKNNLLRT